MRHVIEKYATPVEAGWVPGRSMPSAARSTALLLAERCPRVNSIYFGDAEFYLAIALWITAYIEVVSLIVDAVNKVPRLRFGIRHALAYPEGDINMRCSREYRSQFG